MTSQQLTQQILAQSKDIAALWQSTKSAHKRIDENDRIIKGIHKLASNIEALTLQVKLLTERMDSSIDRMEKSIKSQGERIGSVEMLCRTAERNEQSIAGLASKVEALEREPAAKWKYLVRQLVTLTAAALVGSALAGILR